jgi:excisionase family DNA binding protein
MPRARTMSDDLTLWARRDSNPRPPASEREEGGHQGLVDGRKGAKAFGVGGVGESSGAVEMGGIRRDFATPLLQGERGAEERLLTVKEAALALRVCTATVYRMCERGNLPHVRVSNAVRIPSVALSAYVRTG